MRKAPITLLATALCILVPASVSATPTVGEPDNGFSKSDEHALRVYVECWDQFKSECGRNIVDDGLANGNAPSDARVAEWTGTMQRWLHPPAEAPEPVAVNSSVDVAPAPASPTVTPDAGLTAPVDPNCESGGDPTTNTGNGYYGAYQFDSGTWDAYGDPAYGEANEAPMDVQTAAANSVPYDAWPNC